MPKPEVYVKLRDMCHRRRFASISLIHFDYVKQYIMYNAEV